MIGIYLVVGGVVCLAVVIIVTLLSTIWNVKSSGPEHVPSGLKHVYFSETIYVSAVTEYVSAGKLEFFTSESECEASKNYLTEEYKEELSDCIYKNIETVKLNSFLF